MNSFEILKILNIKSENKYLVIKYIYIVNKYKIIFKLII